MNFEKILTGPAGWALVIGVGGLVLYILHDKLKKDVGDAAAGAAGYITGDNAITQNQHDYSGEPVDAYQGKGVAGTLGAAANSASGGAFASWGEALGGWLADLTMPYDPNAPRTLQTRKQAVGDQFYNRGVLQ